MERLEELTVHQIPFVQQAERGQHLPPVDTLLQLLVAGMIVVIELGYY